MNSSRWVAGGCGAGLALVLAWGAAAAPAPADRTEAAPAAVEGVGVEPKIGDLVPLDVVFKDETGKAVRLGDYFTSGRPVILNLLYFRCPSICSPLLQALVAGVTDMPPDWTLGREFDVLTVSFDHLETPALAAAKKQSLVQAYGRNGAANAGWHVLTGEQASVRALTDAVGFKFKWDPQSNQFVHDVAVVVLSPQGRITHYFRTFTFDPRSLKLALVESSQGRLGSALDKFSLWTCYQFDPSRGTYTVAAQKILRAGGALTIALVAVVVGGAVWARRRRAARVGA